MGSGSHDECRELAVKLLLEVYGTPAPQGSHRAFVNPKTGRAIVTQASSKTKPWRDTVRAFAHEHRPDTVPEGPIWLRMTFSVARPATAAKRVVHPTKRPDCDKYARAVSDSLVDAGWLKDDAQVVDLRVRKVFAGSADRDALDVPGVKVEMMDEAGHAEDVRWRLVADALAERLRHHAGYLCGHTAETADPATCPFCADEGAFRYYEQSGGKVHRA